MRRSTIALVAITLAVIAAAALLRSNDSAPDTSAVATATSATTDDDPGTTNTSPTPSETTSTTTATGPLVTPTLTLPDGIAVCDLYSTIEVTGSVESPNLVEASGLAYSRTTPGVMWSHNDSRDGPRLYALGTDGSDLGTFEVTGGFAFDWEDIGAGPDSNGEGSYLYVGDIGDNFDIRDGLITLHRVQDMDPADMTDAFPESAPIALVYPDGGFNAEALFIDPVDPAVYVITKSRTEAFVYRGSIELVEGALEMELVATLFLDAEVSGADISADGSLIALRGYNTVWMWHRTNGQTIAQALGTEPCEAPSPNERQGESIAIDPELNYWTLSEGTNKDINFIAYEG
jgi:hypothetical protein